VDRQFLLHGVIHVFDPVIVAIVGRRLDEDLSSGIPGDRWNCAWFTCMRFHMSILYHDCSFCL
jgi:hypothetical protein